ncbi:MAG: methyltransferase [Pseudomonadota bacterium]
MVGSRAFGANFDSVDDVIHWGHNVVFGGAVINLMNRAGLTARLLDGPATAGELAQLAGIPADKMARMLDFLLAHEMLARDAAGAFVATSRTAVMHEAAAFFPITQITNASGTQLLPALQRGQTPFEAQFGAPVFEYYRAHPQAAADFGRYMGLMTRRVERFLLTQHRFQPFAMVADIGGSMGDLLLAILRDYPGTRGILFDRPDVVDLARPAVAASPLADRVELVGGSFFETVPAADLYTLKQILHDWDDAECRHILGSIRAAMPTGARVAVIDHVLDDVPVPNESQATDIAMMVWDTGRERKLAEFQALFAASGFAIDRLTRNPAGHSVLELVLS